jgi:hypothetical protein
LRVLELCKRGDNFPITLFPATCPRASPNGSATNLQLLPECFLQELIASRSFWRLLRVVIRDCLRNCSLSWRNLEQLPLLHIVSRTLGHVRLDENNVTRLYITRSALNRSLWCTRNIELAFRQTISTTWLPKVILSNLPRLSQLSCQVSADTQRHACRCATT